ncbi:MAG: hypothetical protein KTR31_01545 [Myxococcales bacterium]|nr:hypothetical protein [Myxococcales bacterium]
MRTDLLALDAEALVRLANKGLVRRATKLLDKGKGPVCTEARDGTLQATFPDGVALTWPPATPLAAVTCSCGASAACFHAVAVALSYGDPQGTSEEPAAHRSVGTVSDDVLHEQLGPAAVARAKRWVREGLVVRLEHGPPEVAHLPSGTVRFVAADALHLAHCDVVGEERGASIAVAVWAFRAAEPGADEVMLGERASVELQDVHPVQELVATCLRAGVSQLPATLRAELAAVQERARDRGWVWVAGALADLDAQWTAYEARSAAHRGTRAASVLGELLGRTGAVVRGGTGQLLGVGEAPNTRLDYVTLMGLGARVSAHPEGHQVSVYLLDRSAGVVLVLQRVVAAGEALLEARAGRRLALSWLATGQLATRGARRSAHRTVSLAEERKGSRHERAEGVPAWSTIEAPIRVASLAAWREELAARAPRCLRPRRLAENVRVVEIAEVMRVAWSPGAQELHAWCRMASGDALQLQLAHDPATPGACGALQHILEHGCTEAAGHLAADGERLVLVPTALRTASGTVLAPALASGAPVTAPVMERSAQPRALVAALRSARTRLADLAHLGLGNAAARRSVGEVAPQLTQCGLRKAAQRMREVAEGGGVSAWADAWLTTEVSLEQLG